MNFKIVHDIHRAREDVHKRFKVRIKTNSTVGTDIPVIMPKVKFMPKNETNLFVLCYTYKNYWYLTKFNSDFCWPDYMVSKLKYGLEYDNTNTSISIWDFLAILAINNTLYCPI